MKENIQNRPRHIVFNCHFCAMLIAFVFFIIPHGLFSQSENPGDVLKKVADNVYMLSEMTIDVSNGSVIIPCKINMNEGLIEVVLCRREGKVHESLLTTYISPLEFQTAMLLLGLDPVNEMPDDESQVDLQSPLASIETPGDSVLLFLSWDVDGKTIKKPLESFIYDQSVDKDLKPSTWLFRGPVTHKRGFIVLDPDVSIIATYHDQMALMELNAQSKFNDELFYVDKDAKLTVGKPVNLVVEKIKN